MSGQTRMAWEEEYSDGSGIERAIRYNAFGDGGEGIVEFEAIQVVEFSIRHLDWLIDHLEDIRNNIV